MNESKHTLKHVHQGLHRGLSRCRCGVVEGDVIRGGDKDEQAAAAVLMVVKAAGVLSAKGGFEETATL